MAHTQNLPAVGPTTASQDFLAAVLGALMPLGAGFAMLLGYTWGLGFFGVFLGAGAAVWWGYWWYQKHQAFFPRDLRGASVGGIGAIVALLGLIYMFSL